MSAASTLRALADEAACVPLAALVLAIELYERAEASFRRRRVRAPARRLR